jgi:hypothetical protein
MPPETLIISASRFSIIKDPDRAGSLLVHLHIPDNQLGMKPGHGFALRMSAVEAREFAAALVGKAGPVECQHFDD